MDKNSLLASLTGEADLNGVKNPDQEQDLFGDLPVEDDQNIAMAPPLADTVGGSNLLRQLELLCLH